MGAAGLTWANSMMPTQEHVIVSGKKAFGCKQFVDFVGLGKLWGTG